MEEHVKLRFEHAKLVREGKREEALKVLRKIQKNAANPVNKKESKKEVVETKKDLKKKVNRFTSLSDLTKISGLGKKSLDDIKKQFDTMEELKNALIKDRVALRDDVVEKLKEVLI